MFRASSSFSSPLLLRSSSIRTPSCYSTTRLFLPSSFLSPLRPSSSVPLSHLSESFLDGNSAVYVEDMYVKWKSDPSSVHASWDSYFKNADSGLPPGAAFTPPPTLHKAFVAPSSSHTGIASDDDLTLKATLLVRAYQLNGHHSARVNPLTDAPLRPEISVRSLDPSTYGFTDADMDKTVNLGRHGLVSGFSQKGTWVLRDLINKLKETYTGTIGVEYVHIPSRTKCNWLRERLETSTPHAFSDEDKRNLLDRLMWSDDFERFLDNKFNEKRFGLDGCEALIPGLKSMIDTAAKLGAGNIAMGMPHRGRLNVLANVVRKPLRQILAEFSKDSDQLDDVGLGSGDVKYHLGTSCDRPVRNSDKTVHISLASNPSHLEAVNPVVLGKIWARQWDDKDVSKLHNVPVLLHGDAAFQGQGVVYESLDLSNYVNYHTGGCIHIIINNQIGFTTDPKRLKRPTVSPYSTEPGKLVEAPIFHVNGDDPEAVVRAMNLAVEYRQTFSSDVVLDIVCYRKHGHNEMDQPRFTQPVMYKKVDKQIPVRQKYTSQLLDEGVVTKEWVSNLETYIKDHHEAEFEASKTYVPSTREWLSDAWSGVVPPDTYSAPQDTNIEGETYDKLVEAITTIPEGFTLHRNIAKVMKAREKSLRTGEGIDWGTAEALAFGSLMLEDVFVRLSGQDVERGTFSHRHAVLHDQKDGSTSSPLVDNLGGDNLVVCNSPLSEFAVLGFEHGVSLDRPNSLVLWEAQFGDFANGAQVMFDQFIATGEQKWGRQSGLTMLLPHGYAGQGPEHSSARLERFLQLADGNPYEMPPDENESHVTQAANWQVINPTTPANYFHALRRQVHRKFRKPLVVMSPKRLLKFAPCVSKKEDFTGEGQSRFLPLLPDADAEAREGVRRLILCSGNVYYDAVAEREAREAHDVAIVRIEQLYPFPFHQLKAQGQLYPDADVVWLQEEPRNMGAWHFVHQPILTALSGDRPDVSVSYAGRKEAASPATGSVKTHFKQLKEMMEEAFSE